MDQNQFSLVNARHLLSKMSNTFLYSAKVNLVLTREELFLLSWKLLIPINLLVEESQKTSYGGWFYFNTIINSNERLCLSIGLNSENLKLFDVEIVTASPNNIQSIIKIKNQSAESYCLLDILKFIDDIFDKPNYTIDISLNDVDLEDEESDLCDFEIKNFGSGVDIIKELFLDNSRPPKTLYVIHSITFLNKISAQNFLDDFANIKTNLSNILPRFNFDYGYIYGIKQNNELYTVNICYSPALAVDFPVRLCAQSIISISKNVYKNHIKIFY